MSLLTLDQNLTESLYGLIRNNVGLQKIIYDIASYPIFLLPLILIWLFWQKNSRSVAVKIFLFTIFTWQVLNLGVGTFVYNHYAFRDRPFADSGLKEFFFEQPQKSFPSDHAAVLMFVTLALFYYRQKTWAWIFLIATIISSVARVAIGFHWVGDILGGWLIGLIGFGLLVILDQPFQSLLDKIWRLVKTKDGSIDQPEIS